MVRESSQKSGEKIKKIQCTRRTGKSDLNAKLIHQMRHNTQVIIIPFIENKSKNYSKIGEYCYWVKINASSVKSYSTLAHRFFSLLNNKVSVIDYKGNFVLNDMSTEQNRTERNKKMQWQISWNQLNFSPEINKGFFLKIRTKII